MTKDQSSREKQEQNCYHTITRILTRLDCIDAYLSKSATSSPERFSEKSACIISWK